MEDPEDKEDDENEILEGGQDAFSHPDLVKSIPTLIYWRSGREGGGRSLVQKQTCRRQMRIAGTVARSH
jgi:hypothetical protein